MMNTTLSVIIPAYNEIYTINDIISHLYSQGYSRPLEIIVVDGHPARSTLKSIMHSRVKKVSSAKGRGRQMNIGAQTATGSMLLFLHADTILPVGGLETIAQKLLKDRYDAGAFALGIHSPKKVYRIIEKGVALRYRITGIPYGDQAFFIQKAMFNRVKGFPEIAIMEDVAIMKKIKKVGARIAKVNQKVLTSPRRWEDEGIIRCTLRNYLLISLHTFGVPPDKLIKYYR